MAPGIPMWLEVLRAVAPLLAALLAAGVGAWVAHKFGRIQEGIARQQAETAAAAAHTARNKLKLDLLEKRLATYGVVKSVCNKALGAERITAQEEITYLEGISGARWLFGKNLEDFLGSELYSLIRNMRLATDDLRNSSPDFKDEHLLRIKDLLRKIEHARARTDGLFEPYLRLDIS